MSHKQTLTPFDSVFLKIMVYPVAPITFLLLGWWGSLPFFQDKRVAILALIGLLAGIFFNHFYVQKRLPRIYTQSDWSFFAVALFYNLGMFGFFMGVPLFHIFLGIPAGIFVARQALWHQDTPDFFEKRLAKIANMTTALMIVVCLASAFFALRDPYTSANLHGMLGLSFYPTTLQIIGLILIGGAGLIVGQRQLLRFCAHYEYRHASL